MAQVAVPGIEPNRVALGLALRRVLPETAAVILAEPKGPTLLRQELTPASGAPAGWLSSVGWVCSGVGHLCQILNSPHSPASQTWHSLQCDRAAIVSHFQICGAFLPVQVASL